MKFFAPDDRIVKVMDETEVIAAICQGADRYEELVERYHTGLIIHCEQLVGDRDEAEDLAQQAFIKAYTHLARFNPQRARFSTWLHHIATNLAIDHLRQRSRKVVVEDIERIAEATMPTFLEDDQKQTVRRAVQNLTPPAYKRVIMAYYWEGKDYRQIARELNVPSNTVGTWMRRAKMQLKETLEDIV